MAFSTLVTVPSPQTWSSGEIVKAPYLRADVSDAVAFLSNRPVFIGNTQAGASVASSGTDSNVNFEIEFYDNWGGHRINLDPARYFCQAPGWYLCKIVTPYTYTGATQFLFISGFSALVSGVSTGTIRGARQLISTYNPYPQSVDLIHQVVTGAVGGAGDSINGTTLQLTGAGQTLQTGAGSSPYMVIRWVASSSTASSLPVPSNPSWPTPPTVLTAAFMNTNIRDTINFLLNPPFCKAIVTGGTLANTVFPASTVVNFGSVTVDNYSGFTTGATGGYTAPVDGNYFCYGQVNLAPANVIFNHAAGFKIAGGTTIWGDSVAQTGDPSNGMGAQVGKRLRLTAGQKVQLVAQQNSGGALAYGTGADQCRMIVVWEGA